MAANSRASYMVRASDTVVSVRQDGEKVTGRNGLPTISRIRSDCACCSFWTAAGLPAASDAAHAVLTTKVFRRMPTDRAAQAAYSYRSSSRNGFGMFTRFKIVRSNGFGLSAKHAAS